MCFILDDDDDGGGGVIFARVHRIRINRFSIGLQTIRGAERGWRFSAVDTAISENNAVGKISLFPGAQRNRAEECTLPIGTGGELARGVRDIYHPGPLQICAGNVYGFCCKFQVVPGYL